MSFKLSVVLPFQEQLSAAHKILISVISIRKILYWNIVLGVTVQNHPVLSISVKTKESQGNGGLMFHGPLMGAAISALDSSTLDNKHRNAYTFFVLYLYQYTVLTEEGNSG